MVFFLYVCSSVILDFIVVYCMNMLLFGYPLKTIVDANPLTNYTHEICLISVIYQLFSQLISYSN